MTALEDDPAFQALLQEFRDASERLRNVLGDLHSYAPVLSHPAFQAIQLDTIHALSAR